MTILSPTPGQTVGPFFGYALPYDGGSDLVPPSHPDAIRLHGQVLDGRGQPVPDALVEIWQAAPDGSIAQRQGSLHRDGWTFTGWGRAATDNSGHYAFSTLQPGPPAPGKPAFFSVVVFARGLLDRLHTRAYLPGDRLADDLLLGSLDPARRRTLVAVADQGIQNRSFRFDIRLQGEDETVFLRFPRHYPQA
ncbi:MAG TPA: protocatechuate 3,4-dioxygenase subunit alpha [Streptosporangiaceae bacterium]